MRGVVWFIGLIASAIMRKQQYSHFSYVFRPNRIPEVLCPYLNCVATFFSMFLSMRLNPGVRPLINKWRLM